MDERATELIAEIAGSYDMQADEYEKRIADYEELLSEIDSMLENYGGAQGTDNPDGIMSTFLLDEDELTDTVDEGKLTEKDSNTTEKKDAVEALRRIQEMGIELSDSIDDPEYDAAKRMLGMLKDTVETAITETKADYAELLDNIKRLAELQNIIS